MLSFFNYPTFRNVREDKNKNDYLTVKFIANIMEQVNSNFVEYNPTDTNAIDAVTFEPKILATYADDWLQVLAKYNSTIKAIDKRIGREGANQNPGNWSVSDLESIYNLNVSRDILSIIRNKKREESPRINKKIVRAIKNLAYITNFCKANEDYLDDYNMKIIIDKGVDFE